MIEPDFIYAAKLETVKDGDTVILMIDVGFDAWIYSEIRFYGINAYETTRRGSWDNDLTEEEIEDKIRRGYAAKALIRDRLERAEKIIVQTYRRDTTGRTKKGKYGRWIGTIWADGVDLGELLVSEDLAVNKDY